MSIAIIPARGGSKRIPRKNIRPFAGRPIIGYSIAAAKQSELFEHVIVSTDDAEIARVAKELGAEAPFLRPAALADDFTGTNAVVRHALEWARDEQVLTKYACCIYATAPLIRSDCLREGYQKLVSSGKSYVFSMTRFSYPIQRAIRRVADGTVEPFFQQYIPARSQDLEEAYHDAAQFYWGTSEAFLNDIPMLSSASLPMILPRKFVLDIDTPEDWEQAELMFAALKSTGAVA